MPMDFPDMASLKRRAAQREFRQPHDGETEEQFRIAFSDYLRPIDPVESAEVRSGMGWNKQDPFAMLVGLLRNR